MSEFEDLRFQDALNLNTGVGRGKELKSKKEIKKNQKKLKREDAAKQSSGGYLMMTYHKCEDRSYRCKTNGRNVFLSTGKPGSAAPVYGEDARIVDSQENV